MKIYFRHNGNIIVVSLSKTTNKKIAPPTEKVVQTYTFSEQQFKLVKSGKKFKMYDFFEQDKSNCLDCTFSGASHKKGIGAKDSNNKPIRCYTHKYMQFSGFISMLKSIKSVPKFSREMGDKIVEMCSGNYVRFGTYGEPTLLPFDLITRMASASKSYTGYTHQWQKSWALAYGNYFMASVHNQEQADKAQSLGYRSFIAKESTQIADGIQCPASKESNYVSYCSKCSLCSGKLGKGNRDVKINLH
jgi:hypothetical protein